MKYRLVKEREKLNYEIDRISRQLASVEKRLRMAKLDVLVYGLFLAVPPALMKILAFLRDIGANSASMHTGNVAPIVLIRSAFSIAHDALFVIYLLFLPALVYNLVKSCVILYVNHRDEAIYREPDEKRFSYYKFHSQERSYVMERNKLACILSRYYLYRETLDHLENELSSEAGAMTEDALEQRLSGLVYYEEITPVSQYGPMAQNAKKIALYIMAVVIVCIIGYIVSAIF